jgi:hypothetical protein
MSFGVNVPGLSEAQNDYISRIMNCEVSFFLKLTYLMSFYLYYYPLACHESTVGSLLSATLSPALCSVLSSHKNPMKYIGGEFESFGSALEKGTFCFSLYLELIHCVAQFLPWEHNTLSSLYPCQEIISLQ